MAEIRTAPAELSIWFPHHSALCSTVYTKLLCNTVGVVSVMNHTLKGHWGYVLVCMCQSVYICSKPLCWAHLTASGLLDVSLPSTKITPEINISYWHLLIKGKNSVRKRQCHSLLWSVYVCVCVCELYVCDRQVTNSDLVSSCFCWGIMGKGHLF